MFGYVYVQYCDHMSYDVMVREKLITLSTIQTLEIENSQLNNKVSVSCYDNL